MQKTEITVQCFNSIDQVEEVLKQANYNFLEEYCLYDYYFSKFDNPKLLEYQKLIGSSILVRQVEQDGQKESKICYKNKIFDEHQNVISEEKINSMVSNFENTVDIFEHANLTCWCKMINHSKVFKKDGIEIAVQDVDGLGIFLEIEEYPNISHLSPIEKIEKLKQVVQSLNLSLGNDYFCKKPYMILHKN